MIKATLNDMIPFLTILALVVLLMTITTLVTIVGDDIKYHTLLSHFTPKLGETYEIIFGENPEPSMGADSWTIFLFFSIFVNIVCLNLLIAILSNTFDNVQA